jgi:hypothetical protein
LLASTRNHAQSSTGPRSAAAKQNFAPAGQDDDARIENIEEIVESDIVSENSQGTEEVENLKMKERCGNVIENKGPACSSPGQSRNPIENKGSCSLKAGMLLKTKG